jgi:3-methyl-2-oxobutanoate hydroxymethyltransferase
MLVLELVPEELSRTIARSINGVVIGIGSGRGLDGEVQVVNDILGITERSFRHTRSFGAWREQAQRAIGEYTAAVRERRFPEERNVTHLPLDVEERVIQDEKAWKRST